MKTYSLTNPLQHDPKGGQEIHDLQRALEANHFYAGRIDGIFGSGTAHACKTAKWRYGYPSRAVQLTGGQQLFDYLTGKKELPAAYKIRRKARGFGLTQNDKIRRAIVDYARWGIANTALIHYAQRRPMPIYFPKSLPLYTDCSGFVTLAYKVGGAADPNGLGYNGQGYTGTLLDHGQTIPLYAADIADLVIWGSWPGHHVAVVIDKSNPANPLLASHGSESGPDAVSLLDETAAQRRTYVVKRYIGK